MMRTAGLFAALLITAGPSLANAVEVDVTLRGSRASMERQNAIARGEDFSFLRTPGQVLSFVDNGYLVPLAGNADYRVLAGYPYARPVVRAFIERLAADYRDACGERLVVTSLTRPALRQPGNASALSVHPAGMATDLRVSQRASCRDWLSAELLRLESRGVLDATREFRPPHFHVAVFPGPYEVYERSRMAEADAAEAIRRLEEAQASQRYHELWEAAMTPAAAPAATVVPQAPLIVRIAAALALLVLPI